MAELHLVSNKNLFNEQELKDYIAIQQHNGLRVPFRVARELTQPAVRDHRIRKIVEAQDPATIVISEPRQRDSRPKPKPTPPRDFQRWSIGWTMILLGVGFAAVGLYMNGQTTALLGRTPEMALVMRALGYSVDGFAVIVLAAGLMLLEDRRWVLGAAVLCAGVLAFGLSIIATSRFVGTNLTDSLASRAKTVMIGSSLEQQLKNSLADRAQADRQQADVEATVRNEWAKPLRDRDWRPIKRKELDVKAAKDLADSRIESLTGQIKTTEKIGMTDPAGETIAKVTQGTVTADAVESFWLLGISFTPVFFAALCFACSRQLLRRK